ncbi:MAG TPA: carboxypeptidase-like regulatory domain-containing protein [Pyrinomonadaceae bacterium]|jgi:hypothetical protein
MKNLFYKTAFALGLFCFFAACVEAQVYTLEKTAVAGGGMSGGAGGIYTLGSTTGQAAAGNALRGAPYAVTVGFWSYSPLAPTSANVSISGRVLTADGQGIRNARLVLTDSSGAPRFAQAGSFGYFHFENVPVGETYVLTIYSNRFTFAQSSQVISLNDELTDVNFISD